MSAESFFTEALPYANQVHAQMPEMFVSVILSQWGIETGYGGPDWSPRNNPGNVGDTQAGGQVTYPTLEAGVKAYMRTLKLGYYNAVRAATTWTSQAIALGQSPWAASHYGKPPGSDLIQIIDIYNLTQYDPVAPVPSVKEANMLARDDVTGGNWVARSNATIYAFNGAPYLGPLPKYTLAWGIGTPSNPVVGIVSDAAGGYILATDNGGPEPAVYHITSDGQYAK